MRVLTGLALLARLAWADYAWIAEPEHLNIRTGLDVYSTTNNWGNDAFLHPIVFPLSGQLGNLSDVRFWVQPEYGIADGWSASLKMSYLNGTLRTPGTPVVLASGSGMGDLYGNVKWRFSNLPLLTLEGLFKVPTGVASPGNPGDIVRGEGNLDLGAKLHYGYQWKTIFLSASAGLLARFGGYSSAFTGDLAGQFFIQRAYAKIFLTSIVSFVPESLPGGTLVAQTLGGTGGSYARLDASPTGFAAGGDIGVLITKNFRAELEITRSLWGMRYPDFVNITVNLLGLFDFSAPDLRPKIREVPFENASSDP